MKRVRSVLYLILMTVSITANAGTGSAGATTSSSWNWGEHEIETKGYWQNLEHLLKGNKYDEAIVPLTALLHDAPDLHVALYINAIKVYEKRALAETDPIKKVNLEDSTLMLYEKRIALFGDEANVLNREGRVAWYFLADRGNSSEQLYSLYAKIYELNQVETYPENLDSYMKAACVKYANKQLNKEEVIKVFTVCSATLDNQLNATMDDKQLERIGQYKARVNQVFASQVSLTETDLTALYQKQFIGKENLETAKSIVSLCIGNKSVGNEAFVGTAEYLIAHNEANYSLCKTLGNVYSHKNETEKAAGVFTSAMTMTEDSLKKAELSLELAELSIKKGNLLDARQFALNATIYNQNMTSAFNLIGDLYFNNACASGNTVQDRAVYIAAYNMYKKAGNTSGTAKAKDQFPSKEELFLINKKAGDIITTGCWINENVALQTRN